MNLITIVTGYMGSGSSAVSDLLSEFSQFKDNNGDFEYVLMHCPDGMFDLEDKLLRGNNVIRSDEAINRFEKCMKLLYDTKNFWPGMYKKRVSKDFLNIVNKFVDSIVDFKHDDDIYWYYQQIPNSLYMQLKLYFARLIKVISFNKIIFKTTLEYKGMRISYPSSESFYSCARDFLKDFYDILGYKEHSLLLDQFLLPHNLYRLNNYFDDNVRVIVVERDPRDIFILNKYLWAKNNCPVAYPKDVYNFCDYYKKMRCSERYIDDSKILRIYFEDLIYDYEESLKRICFHLNLDVNDHKFKLSSFNPKVSLNNTQVFRCSEKFKDEVNIIEKELYNYLYKFPYNNCSNIKNSF